MTEIDDRKELARILLGAGMDEADLSPFQLDADALPLEPGLLLDLNLSQQFPEGLAPVPQDPGHHPDANAPIPETADVLVITWTVDELDALADVMTPGFSRRRWHYYRHRFDEVYEGQIRSGAPAKKSRRLGSWFKTMVGDLSVICFKSELHLNQDGVYLNEDGTPASGKTGYATLPVKELFKQLIAEVQPNLIITTGTSGATYLEHDIGDVVVTRGAKFRLSDEFRNEPYNQAIYKSEWDVPTAYFDKAEELMQEFADNLVEPGLGGPTKRYPLPELVNAAPPNRPGIVLDGRDIPEFHPILTTDFFEFGTSDNNLKEEGGAVEMGDAVLGMVCDEMDNPPEWLVVRNLSDPQINADLPIKRAARRGGTRYNMQTMWAVWYYETYGYWTSVNGALACWAVIAGLQQR